MRKRRLFTAAALAFALVLGLVLAGCPTDDGGGNSGNNTGNTGGNTGGNAGGSTSTPSSPTGVTAVRNSTTTTTVTVSWNAVSGATGYKVYYSSTGSGSGTLEGSPTTTSFNSTNNSTTGTHYFRVSAVNSAGEGSPSSWVSVGPVSGGGGGGTTQYYLDQPTFSTYSRSGNNIAIAWTLSTSGQTTNGLYTYIAPSSITIQVYNGTDFDNVQTLSGTVRSFTLNNYAVYAYSPAGVSGTRVTIRVLCTNTSGTNATSRYSTITYFVEANSFSPSY